MIRYKIDYGYKGEFGDKVGIHSIKAYCNCYGNVLLLSKINRPDGMYVVGISEILQASSV